MNKRYAIIIGAGPAGLTAAWELLERSDIIPIILESSDHVGGISATIDYKGNKIDIGGHRFFSKSPTILEWWFRFLPLQNGQNSETIFYRNTQASLPSVESYADPNHCSASRHLGLLYIVSLTYLWMRYTDAPMSTALKNALEGVAMLHIGIALAIIPVALTTDFSQSRSMAGIIRAIGISEKNATLISYNSPAVSAVLPHISETFKKTYQIEQQQFGSYMVWTQDYLRNRKLSNEEILRRVRAIIPSQKGKRIFFLTSQTFVPTPSFTSAFRRVRRSPSESIIGDELYDLYELR